MKKLLPFLSATIAAVIATCFSLKAAEEQVFRGLGLCAKCELGKTDTCQNAIKFQTDAGEKIVFLAHNAVSKAFHKNLCSGTTKIAVVGQLKEAEGKRLLTATKISLARDDVPDGDVVKGEGLCLKCKLGLTPNCQNGIVVKKGDQEILYVLEHNEASQGFHKHLCSGSAPVEAIGKVQSVAGLKKLTATKLTLAKAQPVAAKTDKPVKAVAKKKEGKAEAKKKQLVTIKGEGCCAKCKLGETDTCQNAIAVDVKGKKKIYYFAANDTSKGFHKHLCQGTANIFAVGKLSESDGKPVFTASKLELQKEVSLDGEGLCLKCGLGKSKTCQNVVRIKDGDKEVLYVLDQNAVSKKFHKHVCQETVKVAATGTVAKINGQNELTALTLEVK